MRVRDKMAEDEKTTTDEPLTIVKNIVAYRKESGGNLGLLLLAVVILVGMLWLLVFIQFTARPNPMVFSLNSKSQIITPVPLDMEGIEKPALLNWVNDLLFASFSYNYSNIDRQPAKVADYLSENAMKSYINLLKTDDDLNAVTELKYVVSVQPKKTPEIITSRAFRGRYAWQIKIPIVITLSNALMKTTQESVIEYLVLRVPETESPLGIKVAGFNFKVERRSRAQQLRQGY